MKYKKYVLVVCFFLSFLSLCFLNLNYETKKFVTSDASDINLDETSLTVPYGTNIQEDKPYVFSGEFYDITDDQRIWTDDCYLETQYSQFYDEISNNDTITNLDNTETQSPSNSSISMTSGTQYQNGTFDLLDDDPAIFNSTDDSNVEAGNITVNYGSEISSGNMTEIDGSYGEYESSYESNLVYVDNFTTHNGTFLQNGTIFNSTYSFENDAIGGNPEDWIIDDESGGTVNVIEIEGDHHNVIEMSDTSGSALLDIHNDFTLQENGTVEYFMRSSNTYNAFALTLRDGSTNAIYVTLYQDFHQYNYGGWNQIVSASDDTWYHIRIDFECGTGSYMGLSADTYNIFINGVQYGAYSFTTSVDSVNNLRINTNTAASAYVGYIDAVGYSWEANGMYNGSYSFENETGLTGTSIPFISSETGYDGGTEVIYKKYNHIEVLSFQDDVTAGEDPFFESEFDDTNQGTIEFWFLVDYTDKYLQIDINDGATACERFRITSDQLWYTDTGSSWVSIMSLITNKWYHFSFQYTSSNQFSLYIDDDLELSSISLDNSQSDGMDTIKFKHFADSEMIFYLDAIGYDWLDNYTLGDNWIETEYGFYDIGDNLYSNDADLSIIDNDYIVFQSNSGILNFTSIFQVDIDGMGLNIFHSLKTNISQEINILLYNFDTSEYDLLNSSISLEFTEDHFLLNSSHYNATNHIILNVIGINSSYDFYLYFEMIYLRSSSVVEIESLINCDLLENLVYSYKTNITQSVELYLYNFTSSSYDLIENESYLSFYLNYTTFYPEYHNGTTAKVKFRAVNSTFNDFTFYLEVLKLINITRLDFTCYVELEEFYDYFLYFNCSAWYYTSIPTLMNFSIYDFTNDVWILINSSFNDIGYFKSEYTEDTSDMYDLIDTDNDNQILLRFNALNNTSEFDLFLDCLNVTIHRKLLLSHTKTFTLLGNWRYRFHIPEESYSSSWYYFDVVEHEDNFMAISESPYITKWVMINNDTTISSSRTFVDDFTGDHTWSFVDENGDTITEDYIEYSIITTGDVWANKHYPDDNFGWTTYLQAAGDNWHPPDTDFEYYTFIEFPRFLGGYGYEHEVLHDSYDTYIMLYMESYDGSTLVDIAYNIPNWGEYSLTWNNKPALYYTLYNDMTLNLGFNNITMPDLFYPLTEYDYRAVSIRPHDINSAYRTVYRSKEFSGTTYDPTIYYYMERFINEQNGYIFAQTKDFDTIGIQSEKFSSIDGYSDDYFLITCKSDVSDMNVQLLYDDIVVKTLNLLVDNTDTENQTIEVVLDEDISFNQIRMIGNYDEREYFYCYGIDMFHYDQDVQEQLTTFYVAPEESYSILLDTEYHYLKIYDNDILRIEDEVNITHELQDNLYTYSPTYSIDCRLTLVDQENDLLDLALFEVYITRTLSETTSRISLLDVYFRADLDTTVKFEFYDRFSDFIKNETVDVEAFIFIEITIYSLRVKNDATNQSDIMISKGGSSTEINDVLTPSELLIYKLIEGNYTVNWTNYEDMSEESFNFMLTSDYILTLPTSYFQVYFSVFNYDGLGLDGNLFRFYINDERKNFGFNTLIQDTNNLVVKDFFNATLKDVTVDLSEYTEYNLIVEIYTMFILNNYNRTIKIEIDRCGSDITIEQIIPSRSGLEHRFLPGIEYVISAYEQNDTLIETKTIILDSQYKIVDFGYYHTTVPYDPTPIAISFLTFFWFLIFVIMLISILTVLIIVPLYRRKVRIWKKVDTIDYKTRYTSNTNSFFR